jgi:hypothetical protein
VSQSLSLGIAFAAGLLSFLSPCVLPLVPVYIGYLTGRSVTGGASNWRFRILHALLFVLGFGAVFVALGATAGLVGQVLTRYLGILVQVGGLLLIVLGMHMAGLLKLPGLDAQRRLASGRIARPGYGTSLLRRTGACRCADAGRGCAHGGARQHSARDVCPGPGTALSGDGRSARGAHASPQAGEPLQPLDIRGQRRAPGRTGVPDVNRPVRHAVRRAGRLESRLGTPFYASMPSYQCRVRAPVRSGFAVGEPALPDVDTLRLEVGLKVLGGQCPWRDTLSRT